jgi:hypothetical protein
MATLEIQGYVLVEPGAVGTEALESGLRAFMESGDPPIVFHRDPARRLGVVTRVSGEGNDKVLVWARLPEPPARTELRNVWNQIRSGTIRGLALCGDFAKGHADVRAVSAVTIPVGGDSGFITKVSTG